MRKNLRVRDHLVFGKLNELVGARYLQMKDASTAGLQCLTLPLLKADHHTVI
jgi:hypothetical protein